MDTIHTFEVELYRFENPNITRIVQIKSTDALKACVYANKEYPDWVAGGASIIN